MMKKLLLPIVAVLALALPAQSLATTVTVKITTMTFSPKTVTINQGDTVKWINDDKLNHQLVANNGALPRRSVTTTRYTRPSRARSRSRGRLRP